MRVAVFGTGGVGGYFGGRLAQAGDEVTFIARGGHLQAIQTNGLRVDSLKGDFVLQPARATEDPADAGVVDIVLVGVKAWQVREAGWALAPLVGADTMVVPLQNGVEAPGLLAESLGEGPIVGGLCHIMSFIKAPGHIVHAGLEPHIAFGELDNRPSERCQRLQAAFERAGVWAEVPEDIQAAMWEKFLFIAAISGVGAVTRAPAGKMRALPGTRRMLEGAMLEIYAVVRALHVTLPAGIVDKTLGFIDGLPPEATASMQRDIMAGNPSELEAQNGAVVRMGRQLGVPTPVNEFLYHSLLPQEQSARGEG